MQETFQWHIKRYNGVTSTCELSDPFVIFTLYCLWFLFYGEILDLSVRKRVWYNLLFKSPHKLQTIAQAVITLALSETTLVNRINHRQRWLNYGPLLAELAQNGTRFVLSLPAAAHRLSLCESQSDSRSKLKDTPCCEFKSTLCVPPAGGVKGSKTVPSLSKLKTSLPISSLNLPW